MYAMNNHTDSQVLSIIKEMVMSGSNSKMRTPHTLLSNPFNSLNSDT